MALAKILNIGIDLLLKGRFTELMLKIYRMNLSKPSLY